MLKLTLTLEGDSYEALRYALIDAADDVSKNRRNVSKRTSNCTLAYKIIGRLKPLKIKINEQYLGHVARLMGKGD